MKLTRISRRSFQRRIIGGIALCSALETPMYATAHDHSARTPSLTDLEGLLVGHCTLRDRPTGCTVVTGPASFAAGVDVRGGAPGTRETDLLKPEDMVERVDAVFLSGGSAFGLETATGISRYLEEKGRGYDARVARVPIVCGAILFDLSLGNAKIRPDAESGYEAIKAATSSPVKEGSVGAGAGATVGKMLGMERAMKGGLGSWSIERPDGLRVGAVAAVNSVGDVIDPETGRIVAGARKDDGSGFVDTMAQLRKGYVPGSPFRENTVIAVVATNAALTKTQCTKLAQMAQDALARCIYPSHTPWDGDTVFALSTGNWQMGGKPPDVGLVGALAADVLATAILRGVRMAEPWGPYPSANDFPGRK
jgi:L-aminopeptidase/D-esterase-like protein